MEQAAVVFCLIYFARREIVWKISTKGELKWQRKNQPRNLARKKVVNLKTRRDIIRQGLHWAYTPFYDALCAKLPACWQPISGLRSFADQQAKYNQGRTCPGEIITNAYPGMSFHNYGLATDWAYYHNGEYLALEFDDKQWKEYIDACISVGVDFLKWERAHNQLRSRVRITDLYAAYQKGGMAAVNFRLEKSYGTSNRSG